MSCHYTSSLHCVRPQLRGLQPPCLCVQLPGSREHEALVVRLTGTKESILFKQRAWLLNTLELSSSGSYPLCPRRKPNKGRFLHKAASQPLSLPHRPCRHILPSALLCLGAWGSQGAFGTSCLPIRQASPKLPPVYLAALARDHSSSESRTGPQGGR